MRFVIFTHSLVSDWNHGNVHFLRGVALDLLSRGYHVRIFEPADGWSRRNLFEQHGEAAIRDFEAAFPQLRSVLYDPNSFELEEALFGADVVIVHEWNDPDLIARIGARRARSGTYKLFFHDTHHRSLTSQETMAEFDLRHYDGVLAYGNCIRDIYRRRGWARDAWTWHEAADVCTFYPRNTRMLDGYEGDLIWIGNWGDDERSQEIREFFIRPVQALGLKARVYGVRYPDSALKELARAGIEYGGWLPNYRVPEVFSRFRVTLHIPRRPYAESLHGIPTIRPFEAMACGIPLISAPWRDAEHLFTPGEDFLFAQDAQEMTQMLRLVLSDSSLANKLSEHALRTILTRHTCAHRVNELLRIMQTADGLVIAGGASV